MNRVVISRHPVRIEPFQDTCCLFKRLDFLSGVVACHGGRSVGARRATDQPILKPYSMVRPIFGAYVFRERPHRACPPKAVFRWP